MAWPRKLVKLDAAAGALSLADALAISIAIQKQIRSAPANEDKE